MLRDVVKINEELCNGCGICVPACHEGALQVIDGKVRLISDFMCDGLGACLGQCPQGAIKIEQREAEPYNETKVMKNMANKGANTVIAHMKHLKDHNETGFLKEAVHYLRSNAEKISLDVDQIIQEVHNYGKPQQTPYEVHKSAGCPGSQAKIIKPKGIAPDAELMGPVKSELRQWPVQMHLINPAASYFQNSDVILAADCVAFSMGDFHSKYLKGKSLAIACPKLDDGQESYINKITQLIDNSKINTLTVMIMQVPCCGGLLQIANKAAAKATRKVPIKVIVVSLEGEVLQEKWV